MYSDLIVFRLHRVECDISVNLAAVHHIHKSLIQKFPWIGYVFMLLYYCMINKLYNDILISNIRACLDTFIPRFPSKNVKFQYILV